MKHGDTVGSETAINHANVGRLCEFVERVGGVKLQLFALSLSRSSDTSCHIA
jgi:hypothetical protein